MLEAISPREFAEWLAFLGIEQPGERRMDVRFAQLTTVLANCHTDPKKKRFKVSDFMLDLRSPEQRAKQDAAMRKASEELAEIEREAIAKMNGEAH